jgi:hypothetical protein
VNAAAAPEPPTAFFRASAGLTLALRALLVWLQPPWLSRMQAAWFDSMQPVSPRPIRSLPAMLGPSQARLTPVPAA